MTSNKVVNSNSEKGLPDVLICNEPIQSEHTIDQKFNEMRMEFIPYIKQFVVEHELFKNENKVAITFAQKGASSIIAIIETSGRKLVLKIPRSKTFSAGEGQFLKVWEKAGARVPHVVEIGKLHDFPYTIMEFIDAPILEDKYSEEELINKETYVEMGQMLRLMHTPKAGGYGFVVDGQPEFRTATEWLEGEDMKTRIDYVNGHNLLGSLKDYLPTALEIIKQHADKEGSSYCHDDYGSNNMFATDPITIFDTSPKFNNGYYDLGRVMFGGVAFGRSGEAAEQLLKGYFGGEVCDKQALYAYTFLACYMKFPYWHNTKRKNEMETAISYFTQSKY